MSDSFGRSSRIYTYSFLQMVVVGTANVLHLYILLFTYCNSVVSTSLVHDVYTGENSKSGITLPSSTVPRCRRCVYVANKEEEESSSECVLV